MGHIRKDFLVITLKAALDYHLLLTSFLKPLQFIPPLILIHHFILSSTEER